MRLNKPDKLQKGDTIGIVATSFPLTADLFPYYELQYQKAVSVVKDMGFHVKEAKNLRKTKWWYAGTPQERADDINAMYADGDVKAIIVHEGGQSAIATLELIDYNLVYQNPKPFIGFSDITNIHLAMYTKAGLAGFQGPLLTYSLGKIWEKYLPQKAEEGKQLFVKSITSTEPLGKINPLTQWECWRPGKATGILFGGNLSNIVTLLGTQYYPKLEDIKGCVFFWEKDNSPSYYIEKQLYQLKYSGLFRVISGMMVGKLPGIKKTAWAGLEEPTPKEIILEVLKDYDFPIIGEVDFGHETVSIPMPIGLKATIDAANLTLEFLESAVK
ncbi:MAG: S66 peptidase family protein [Patescibacteria group bacterium]